MSFDYQPHLVGELLEVRPLAAADLDALYEVARDPLLWEQHPDPVRAVRGGFERFFAEQLGSGGGLAVIDRRDGRLVGSSRYHAYDAERREVEIGWTFLARSHWGGVYNAELKRLMLDHAFRYVECVVFHAHIRNIRSQKAIEKLGATRIRANERNVRFELRRR